MVWGQKSRVVGPMVWNQSAVGPIIIAHIPHRSRKIPKYTIKIMHYLGTVWYCDNKNPVGIMCFWSMIKQTTFIELIRRACSGVRQALVAWCDNCMTKSQLWQCASYIIMRPDVLWNRSVFRILAKWEFYWLPHDLHASPGTLRSSTS